MKSVLIFSACLVLVLLLGAMPKTDVREFNDGANSQLVIIEQKAPACLAMISAHLRTVSHESSSLMYSSNNSSIFYRLFYVPQMVGWGRWIGLSHRPRRPYRNPLRRFRLNKKQRRRLRQHLLSLLEQKNNDSPKSLFSMEEV